MMASAAYAPERIFIEHHMVLTLRLERMQLIWEWAWAFKEVKHVVKPAKQHRNPTVCEAYRQCSYRSSLNAC